MGIGRTMKCSKCGYHKTFYLGSGMGFPQEYKKVVMKIRKGTYGKELQNFFENYPGAVVNAETELYQCPGCNYLQADHNLSLYVHKQGQPPENGYWIKYLDFNQEYSYVRSYAHKCPKCRQRMRHITDSTSPVPCPECGELLEEDLGMMRWD